jgi:hypothetical protein
MVEENKIKTAKAGLSTILRGDQRFYQDYFGAKNQVIKNLEVGLPNK